jgi:predicted DCC family thiol-disulfide oxidoreductase YuxK
VLVLPNQGRGVLERYGISRVEADRSAWVVARDGRRQEGAAAVNRVLHEIGGPWRFLAAAYRLGPIAGLEEVLYRCIARNRSMFAHLGVRPECDEAESECE